MERIEELLVKDKFTNLAQMAEILKEEVTPLAESFFVLCDDIVVRYRREGDGFVFDVEIKTSRIKPFGMRIV